MNPSPLRLSTSLDLPRIARATPTRVRVIAEVAADPPDPTAAAADRPPLAVLLALDTSGSMQGDKLRHLVRSVELVVDHLSPRDQVGVVCFANEARIAAPLAPRAAWKPSVVAGLRADGGTNIAAGLDLAAHLFDAQAGTQAAATRGAMVLLSDGQPNIGAASPAELGAIARSLRDRLSISTLGYGEDHSDAVLASIAESGGGGYAFIPSPEQCRIELARVVGAQVDAVADRVALELEPAPGIIGTAAGELRLPDFCAGDQRIATFDLDVPAQAQLGAVALGRLVLSYRRAGGDVRTVAVAVEVNVVERAAPRNAVAHALGLLRDGELARAEASRLVDAGRFADARHTLQCCLARIRDAHAEAPSPRLSELLEQLVDDLALIDQRPDASARAAYRRGQHAMSPQYASPMLAGAYGPIPKATVVVLTGAHAGKPIALGREMTIGRTPSADVQLHSANVSRLHTRIVASDGAFWVNDLGSTDGTRLNGSRITSHRLRDGDVIEIGDCRLLFRGE